MEELRCPAASDTPRQPWVLGAWLVAPCWSPSPCSKKAGTSAPGSPPHRVKRGGAKAPRVQVSIYLRLAPDSPSQHSTREAAWGAAPTGGAQLGSVGAAPAPTTATPVPARSSASLSLFGAAWDMHAHELQFPLLARPDGIAKFSHPAHKASPRLPRCAVKSRRAQGRLPPQAGTSLLPAPGWRHNHPARACGER